MVIVWLLYGYCVVIVWLLCGADSYLFFFAQRAGNMR